MQCLSLSLAYPRPPSAIVFFDRTIEASPSPRPMVDFITGFLDNLNNELRVFANVAKVTEVARSEEESLESGNRVIASATEVLGRLLIEEKGM